MIFIMTNKQQGFNYSEMIAYVKLFSCLNYIYNQTWLIHYRCSLKLYLTKASVDLRVILCDGGSLLVREVPSLHLCLKSGPLLGFESLLPKFGPQSDVVCADFTQARVSQVKMLVSLLCRTLFNLS